MPLVIHSVPMVVRSGSNPAGREAAGGGGDYDMSGPSTWSK